MPPKVTKMTLSTEHFLAACIKNAKEKVLVDFDGVAAETGMSAGGAANKYRAIIKQLEAERAANDDNAVATSPVPKTPKATAKRKAKAAVDAAESETSMKKPRATRSKKTAVRQIKEEQDADDADESNLDSQIDDEGVDVATSDAAAENGVKEEAI